MNWPGAMLMLVPTSDSPASVSAPFMAMLEMREMPPNGSSAGLAKRNSSRWLMPAPASVTRLSVMVQRDVLLRNLGVQRHHRVGLAGRPVGLHAGPPNRLALDRASRSGPLDRPR